MGWGLGGERFYVCFFFIIISYTRWVVGVVQNFAFFIVLSYFFFPSSLLIFCLYISLFFYILHVASSLFSLLTLRLTSCLHYLPSFTTYVSALTFFILFSSPFLSPHRNPPFSPCLTNPPLPSPLPPPPHPTLRTSPAAVAQEVVLSSSPKHTVQSSY